MNTPEYWDKIITYQSEILELDNANLYGYWQNESYFKDIREEVLQIYTFNKELLHRWRGNFEDMMGCPSLTDNENSVSVHIRRKDYMTKDNEKLYGGICSMDYYRRAVKFFEDRFTDLKFYYFSDDTEWVKNVLIPDIAMNTRSFHRIVESISDDVSMDMWLMSKCRHHIIANSTYSWWGSWIGKNTDKIVVAPKTWMSGYDDDVICSGWIRL